MVCGARGPSQITAERGRIQIPPKKRLGLRVLEESRWDLTDFMRGRESPGEPQASKEESAAGQWRRTREPPIFSTSARSVVSARCNLSEEPSRRSQPRPVAYIRDFQGSREESAALRKRSMVRARSAGSVLILAMAVSSALEKDQSSWRAFHTLGDASETCVDRHRPRKCEACAARPASVPSKRMSMIGADSAEKWD